MTSVPPTWPTAAEAGASRLFAPIALGVACTLGARTWVPAMVPWRATPEGHVTDALLAWYGRLAEGRPGGLVVEATGVRDVPSGPLLRIGADEFVPGLRRLVETVRARSQGETRVIIQLIDFLRIRRRPEPKRFFLEFLHVRPAHREALASMGMTVGSGDDALREALLKLPETEWPRVLSTREVEDLRMGVRQRVADLDDPEVRELPGTLPHLFVAAAERARQAGFDGVELHAAHAYTLASFLSQLNTRQDGYGLTREGRLRLPVEVLRTVRRALPATFAVGIRLLADEVVAGGHGVDDAAWFATRFAEAGADFLSLSKGGKFEDARQPAVGQAAYPYTGPSGLECIPTTRLRGGPEGRHLPLARAVRTAVRGAGFETPVVAAGGIHTFRLAEEALARGDVDIVAAARQSLADPHWWLKMRLGRGDEIRRCTHTNYCEGLDQKHKAVTCRLWDRLPIDDGTPTQGGRRLVAPPWAP